MPKLVLIDAYGYLHRAYHALPPLTTSRVEPINAVLGFINDLIRGWNRVIRTLQKALGPNFNLPSIPTIDLIPKLDTGGEILRTGLAVVHRGETVLPANGSPGVSGDVILQIDGRELARISRDQLLRMKRSRVDLGLA